MNKVLSIFLVVIIVGSMLALGYFFYDKSKQDPVVYELVSPEKRDIIQKTVATGTIKPRIEIEMKSAVPGVVNKLYVVAGEEVTKGQLLAKIQIIPNVVSLNNAEARLQTAQINFNNAKRELKRQQELFDDGVISQFDYNQFSLDYKLRQQEVSAAKNNLDLVKEGASKKSKTASNLVYATANGLVLDVPVEEGDYVIESNSFNEGTTITSVANMEDMIFEGSIDESEVGKLKEGMALTIKVAALEDEIFNAKLNFIAPKGLEEEGLIKFEIKADVELKNGSFLRAGYSSNADIVLAKRENVLSINERDIIFESDKKYVELEKVDHTFEKKEIKTGLSDGVHIEVIDGLSLEDQVKKQIPHEKKA